MSKTDQLRRLVEQSAMGGQALMGPLEDIRRKIVITHQAISDAHQVPVSQDEALARLDEWIASVSNTSIAVNFAGRFTSPVFRMPASVVPPELLSAAMCGPLRDMVAEKISEEYGTSDGLSAADRARRIEQMTRQLLELELAEEAIIRKAEDAGIDVLRRMDADPRAVLCHGDFLK